MFLDEKSFTEHLVNVIFSEDSILGPMPFLLYINDLPDDATYNIAIYTGTTTLYSNCD